MYGPPRGTIVMQSLIGQTERHSVQPVQSSSTIFASWVVASKEMDCSGGSGVSLYSKRCDLPASVGGAAAAKYF